ncbi:DUF4926 domain-containing protein [Mycobacterium gastri]|uniref:DUF4926 domain-containing protein n=1 Tax=Mycobacterium gastri TaxID=1777 RepID=A0A1X1VG89_MYCGS|nr:DUF4926 domain-containing protein [Mycobacterium gastri]ETW22124.1 hypothetical protein MGAST_21870 [Mycobacterium gastri 'Wayne']ORV68122.1 hypothetical protein AWC07_08695 [Mycobacterium gastri]
MKPEEHDVVQLRRPLLEYNLPAGSRGAVVLDYTKYSHGDLPPAYEVEFSDADGITQALVTVREEDLEVVWRPDPDK